MINRWNEQEAKLLGTDLLAQRVYTSQLLGKDEDLVLHGGGNTSVKTVSYTHLDVYKRQLRRHLRPSGA